MEKKYSVNYPIYDTVYGNELPIEQYYVINFDTLPSKFMGFDDMPMGMNVIVAIMTYGGLTLKVKPMSC